MQIVTQYLQRNKNKVNQIFDSLSKDKEIPATKVFAFMQQITAIAPLSFIKDGKQFFKVQQNQSQIEKSIQKYYKTTPDGKMGKFYLYRINFQYREFLEFLEYWIKHDKSLVIKDPYQQQSPPPQPSPNNPQKSQKVQPPKQSQQATKQNNQSKTKQPESKVSKQLLIKSSSKQLPQKDKQTIKQEIKSVSEPAKAQIKKLEPENKQKQEVNQQNHQEINIPNQLRQSTILDNQFLVEEQRKAMLIAAYQGQIKKIQQMLLRVNETSEQYKQMTAKIEIIKNKIIQLSQKKQKSPEKSVSLSKSIKEDSPAKMKTQVPKAKKEVNFKLLFQFYAKQNHLTGVKASFERIEHESQTINYQKLVHFLKEHEIFPEKPKDQKRLHNLYVRTCSNTRDLHYQEFMTFLQKLPQFLYQDPVIAAEKKQQMMNKIKSKSQKNKVLHNPFHSLQKQDFRIDPNQIKYQFKIKPVKGKLEEQVNLQLETRKKLKQESKLQLEKQKEQKEIKKLKKLSAIDPYHPLVIKNAQLLREKSFSAMDSPIASLQNMQKFRDESFDMKAMFGISDFKQDPMKPMLRYNMDKKMEMIERQQSLKMSNLMSGIIQRSQAKLVKLGLSPKKRQFSSRLG